MAWRVEFLPAADKAFGKLDRQQQRRIRQFIDKRLQPAEDPHQLGEG
jgi:mRNA-degrading endonuclease RelE of RelBE toxin-antitoxin system